MNIVDTLGELVDISSVTGDEDEIASVIEARFRDRLSTIRVGNSVVVGEPSDKPFVALYGHTDTVPEQGNRPHRIEGDRMIGLGTSDMKAGVAVMIHLLSGNADPSNAADGPVDVVGVFYDKEEGAAADNGLEDVLNGVPWLEDAELSIVLEPTDLRLEMGCNGVINADIVFRGHAAHSARPWLGENAVTKAGRWLADLHDREPESYRVGGLEFREVFSVTRAEGGIANNVLPARFVVNLNHRFPPVFDLAEAETRLREVADTADEIVIKDRAPAAGVPADNSMLQHLAAFTKGEVRSKQGWTDVARLSMRGIPAVNYGPGEVAQAHQASESIAVENLTLAYDALSAFLATS